MTKIGTLETLVCVYESYQNAGEVGEVVYNYRLHSKVFANVDSDISESVNLENYEQGELINLTLYEIKELTTRWRIGIDAKMYEIIAKSTPDRNTRLQTITLRLIS